MSRHCFLFVSISSQIEHHQVTNLDGSQLIISPGSGGVSFSFGGRNAVEYDPRRRDWCCGVDGAGSGSPVNVRAWDVGTYVMAVVMFVPREDDDHDAPMIQAHKIVDLSPYHDREAMWHMEVIEANNLFYDQSTPKRVSKLLSRE